MTHYNKEELKNLEWWRGILAFIVFLAHITQIIWYPVVGGQSAIADIAATLANTSVVLFFMLSGILVSYSAMNLSENGSFNWRKYFVNRFSRIYPSLIFVLILCVVLVFAFSFFNGSKQITQVDTDKYMVRPSFATDAKGIIRSFLMLHPGITVINGPLWSLVIEWWLYISAMFFFLGFSEKNSTVKKWVYYLLLLPPLYLAYHGYGYTTFYYIGIWYLGCFYTTYLRFNPKIFRMLVIAALVGCAGLIVWKGLSVVNIRTTNKHVYGILQFIYSIVFIPLMFKFSGKYFFQAMSKYSYTLYIIHFAVILFVWGLLRPYVGNNIYLLAAESAGVIIVVMLISRYTAKYTENKFFFRNLIEKFSSGKKA